MVRVAMVGEGTYPHSHGGVSVWCHQMVQGLPDVRFHLTNLTSRSDEPAVFDLAGNVDAVVPIALWDKPPARARVSRLDRRQAISVCQSLIDAICLWDAEQGPTLPSQGGAPDLRAMAMALYRWFSLAQTSDMAEVLHDEECVVHLLRRWRRMSRQSERPWPEPPTIADAVAALRFLGHCLRPLSYAPPEADIVHLVANGLSGLVGLATKWRHGTPYILSEHGIYLRERYLSMRDMDSWPMKTFVLRFMSQLTRLTYRHADLVTPGNIYNRRWELFQGADADRIRTVYNGVDPDAFPAIAHGPEEATVAWVGRIDPIKDLETLLRGFALVAERVPNARLRLFGGAPKGGEAYRDRMIALATELGLDGRATFEGRVESIVDAYAAGSVVALTSISEGFPYTVIEAMSCARATVSTDVGGVGEAVGDAGLLVPPRDPERLAEALERVLTDDQLRTQLARAARDRVLSLFTLEHSLGIFRRLYEDHSHIRADHEVRGVAA